MAKRKPTGTGTDTTADQQAKPAKQPPYVGLLSKYGGRTPVTPAAVTMAPHQRFGDRGGDPPDDAPLTRLVRYVDLTRAGIVRNRTQLERLVRDEGMPPGRMLSSKARVWTVGEIEDWLATRPLAGKRADAVVSTVTHTMPRAAGSSHQLPSTGREEPMKPTIIGVSTSSLNRDSKRFEILKRCEGEGLEGLHETVEQYDDELTARVRVAVLNKGLAKKKYFLHEQVDEGAWVEVDDDDDDGNP